MARYSSLDYPTLTKSGFLLGLALLLFGAGGEILGHALFGSLPAWENTLFLYSEILGVAVAFFSVWIFGVYLPLTE